MRLRDLKDALKGKARRVEELEEVVRFCFYEAYTAVDDDDRIDSFEDIEKKCKAALDSD